MAANKNLAVALAAGFAPRLDATFLALEEGPDLSYRDIADRASSFAAALISEGVEPGDRVLVTASKSPDAVALYLGCLQAGAVHVPLNPAFTSAEVDYFIEDAQPQLIVVDATHELGTEVATLSLDGLGGGSLVDAALACEPLSEAVHRDGSDVAAMLYTSGTTGQPKGAMLTHGNLAGNAASLSASWEFTPDDVLIHALPIFHVHGLFVALHCAMLNGCAVRFLARFDVDSVVEALGSSTVFMGVPTHYSRLLSDERVTPTSCRNMRLFTSGSAPLTEATHASFATRTGHMILERYGMTEAGIIATNPLRGDRVAGTVGYALPGVEVRVHNDVGDKCEPGEAGLVEIRGPHLFSGYWGRPEKTASEHREGGWFITGDIGHLDEQGRLTLEGRSSDMIICGGENIYPKEIELCLDSAPAVAESAVVGAPDTDLGERVVAYLVGTDEIDLEVVQRHLDDHLARFKHPRRFEVVSALPRNAMGKVQKAELRAELATDQA